MRAMVFCPGGQKKPFKLLFPKAVIKKRITQKRPAPQKKKARAIKVAQKVPKAIQVHVTDNPLDAYRSPHLLDLSQIRFIEKIKPRLENFQETGYQSLPAGELLSKLCIFELISLENSEILNWIQKIWRQASRKFRELFWGIDFSPKLPLVAKSHALDNRKRKLSIWQEVCLFNIFEFIFQSAAKAGRSLGFLGRYLVFQLGQAFRVQDDEVIDFGLKKETVADFYAAPKAEAKPAPAAKIDWRQVFSQTPASASAQAVLAEEIPVPPEADLLFAPPKTARWPKAARFEGRSWGFEPGIWPKKFILKSLAVFAVLALLVVLPFKAFTYWQEIGQAKGQVLGEAEVALTDLKFAQNELRQLNFTEAKDYFSSANQNFSSAQNQLDSVSSFLTFLAEIIPASNFKSGKNLLALGEHLSGAGSHILTGVSDLTSQSAATSLTDKIKAFQDSNQSALAELALAQKNLAKIRIQSLPAENQPQFVQLKEKLPLAVAGLKKIDEVGGFLTRFLADDDLKRYLVVFQNDNELRATGGFMGSFALVDIKSGQIQNINMPTGGTYDLRAGMKALLEAPRPLQMINTQWEFQDANWWPSWPASAQNISWFYNKSGGPTVDGVIAVNSDWLGELLGIIGEVKLPQYGKTITAENFETELQKNIELETTDKKQPKRILADLAPAIIKRIFAVGPDQLLALMAAVNRGLAQKDILVYATDDELEQFIAQNNWDGRLKKTEKDYLGVVATNIGGGKTDSVVSQKIYHQAEIAADGSVIDRVLISRRHFGPVDKDFTTTFNRSYLRVYVPQGSELIQAAGFDRIADKEFKAPEDYLTLTERLQKESRASVDKDSNTLIYEEDGKTVFANWLQVSPGQSQEALLVYRLPFKVGPAASAAKGGLFKRLVAFLAPRDSRDSYSLLVQKQPGSNDDEVISQIKYPASLDPQILFPRNLTTDRAGQEIVFHDKLNSDLFYFTGFRY